MSGKEIALKVERFQNDKDLEFRVKFKKEMLYVLRGIADQGERVALFYGDDQNFIPTTLLGVDERGMWLNAGPSYEENQQLLLSDKITFVSMHQQIKIQFVADNVENASFKNNEAFYMKLPEYLLRILRREYFRIAIPDDAPISCVIPVPPTGPQGRVVMREIPVMEISGDGIGLLCDEYEDTLLPEKTFRDCQISLPDIGILKTTVVVRSGFNFVTPDNVVRKRVGCSLVFRDNKMDAMLQRYIIRLQGESKKRRKDEEEE